MRVHSLSGTVSRVLVAAGVLVFAAPLAARAALPVVALETRSEPEYLQPVPVPLDRDVVFQEVTVLPGGEILAGDSGEPAGLESRLIYSNTLGIHATNFPANWPVSDDIATTAPDGCNLRTFKFKVLGRVLTTGLTGPYTVKYALYTNCPLGLGSPNAVLRELIKIPGTTGEVTFPDDGPRTIKHMVDPHNPVAIPTNFYLGLQFNRGNCGTVVGAPAMVGFSADQWDFPGFPCYGYLGGFPQLPHASFWLEMYGDEHCPASFPGFKNAQASGPTAILGANVQGADDIKLQVEDCQMVGYEVVVRGVGFYTFDLRRQCDGQVIPGTEKTFQINASTTPQVQVARFRFDPPVPLMDDDLFLGFRTSSNSSGAVLAGKVSPSIGASGLEYFKIGLDGCEPVYPGAGVNGAVNLAITCAGDLPVGACCDMALLECKGGEEIAKRCKVNEDCLGGTCESVCRELPEMNCPWPPLQSNKKPAWVEGGVCEQDPFELPCGLAACCKPDDTCENLTKNECAAVPPLDRPRLWQAGAYCAQDGQTCPFNACLARNGDCTLTHEWGGCSDPFCCSLVCPQDPWCCHVEWDRRCVELAGEMCSSLPANDTCGYVRGQAPVELLQSTPFFGSNLRATESAFDAGFCCNESEPGATGYGTVWFKFVATHDSAQVDTCASDPDGDTLVDVFSENDPTTSCLSPTLIGCGDNEGCPIADPYMPQSRHTRFCVNGLTVGDTYYIMLASKSRADLGTYEIEIKMPCQYLTPFPSGDCNENGKIDGCELSERTSRDCNRDGLLDDCGTTPDSSQDCDADGVIDTCDSFRQRLIAESPSYTFGRTVVFEEDLLNVGDPSAPAEYGGTVHTYERSGDEWVHSESLYNPDPSLYTSFGFAIAGSRQRLLVLAIDSNSDDHVNGRVFAYVRDQHEWVADGFPSLNSEDDANRMLTDVIMEGDLAAVKTGCTGGPVNCNEDVVLHMFRRDGSRWQHDGIVPPEGSFDGRSFAFDLSDGFLAVTTKGKYPAAADSNGSLLVFEKKADQWVQTTQRALWVENATSISFSDTLIAVGGTYSGWQTDRQPAVLSLYRKREGSWDEGGALETGYEASGNLPQVAILSPISLAFTVLSPGKCPTAAIYQRTSYTCDWCGYWFPLTQLNLTHCGSEPRTLSMDEAPSGLAIGIWGNSFYGSPDLPPGSVQLFALPATDCDGSGTSDLCEIQSGLLEDCNLDKAPDLCQAQGYVDYDLDLNVTLRDAAELQNCFSGTSVIAPCCGVFDVSGKQGIDLPDVRSFVAAMTGP